MDDDIEREFTEVYERILVLKKDYSRALELIDELTDRVISLEQSLEKRK